SSKQVVRQSAPASGARSCRSAGCCRNQNCGSCLASFLISNFWIDSRNLPLSMHLSKGIMPPASLALSFFSFSYPQLALWARRMSPALLAWIFFRASVSPWFLLLCPSVLLLDFYPNSL